MTVAQLEQLLTIEEVAKIGAVSITTVRRAHRDGRLKAVRLGPQILRFRPEDVEAWIKRARE